MAHKIGVLVDLLIPGGIQKTAIEEVKNLNRMGFKAKLIILMRSDEGKNLPIDSKKIPFEFLNDKYPKILQKNLKIPYFKFLSIQHFLGPVMAPIYLKKKDYDIVISHGTTTTFSALSLFYLAKIPYLAIVYDPMNYILEKVYRKTPLRYFYFFLKPLLGFLEGKIVKNSHSTFVISKVHKHFIKSEYAVEPKILHLGINPPKKIIAKLGNKILFLGRWDLEKNIEIVFALCNRLPKHRFIVAGTWTNQKDLTWFKSEIKKRQLAKQIDLVSSYSEKDLLKIFRKSSFWAHPNYEAFSLSALEAASFALPIILPQKSGVSELFIDKKHGFFPKRDNNREFIKAVEYLANNPKKAQLMGQEAAKVAKNYTWFKHTKILAVQINKLFKKK